MVLSVSATVVLEITKNGDVADSLNETNVIIFYWFGKACVHCILDYIHCTLELNIAIYLSLLKLMWGRVEVTAPFLILLLKNAKYSCDEINSLCVALKEWFAVVTE